MLLYSIPPYRLPKEVVRKQVHALQSMGIRFEAGSSVDEKTIARIKSDFDAVLLAGGTWRSLNPGVAGKMPRGSMALWIICAG